MSNWKEECKSTDSIPYRDRLPRCTSCSNSIHSTSRVRPPAEVQLTSSKTASLCVCVCVFIILATSRSALRNILDKVERHTQLLFVSHGTQSQYVELQNLTNKTHAPPPQPWFLMGHFWQVQLPP